MFQVNQYQYSIGEHHGQSVIWVHFPYNFESLSHLREHVKARWSQSNKCWFVNDVSIYRQLFQLPAKPIGKNALMKIHPINQPEWQRFYDLLELKGYSPNTIKTYTIEFAQLLYALKDFPVLDLSAEKLRSYMLYCIKDLKLSENQVHSRMNAVKFYFEQVLHREKMFFDIPRPKKPLLLPKSLNMKEVKQLFQVTDNPKHLLILQLCYGMGLRVSEIVNLKIADIDSERMKVFISNAKGKKDRYVNLPHFVLEPMREYYKVYRPKEYLFDGQYGGPYSVRSVQAIFKNAMEKAGISKRIGVHGLRHSYATHLLEMGTDISLIQKLLGHNDIKTTLIYAKATDTSLDKVKSPLDYLGEK